MNKLYITDYLNENARKFGHKKALITEDRTFDWQELQNKTNMLANYLQDSLKNNQAIVAILLPNSWQFVISYFGVVASGFMAMPLDISFKKLEIDNILKQVKPTLIITDKAHLDWFYDNAITTEEILAQGFQATRPKNDYLSPEKQVSTLFYASGTTGKPKLIPNTHRNQLWDITNLSKIMDWQRKDTLLLSLPLSHRHGLVIGLLQAVYNGSTIYLLGRFDADKTLKILSSGDIKIFLSVPAAIQKLVEHNPSGVYNLNKVRLIESAASHLPLYLWQAFKDRFGIEIFDRYGTSETGTIASNTRDERTPGSFGKLLDEIEIKVESTELFIKSPGLFPGYYNNEEATSENFSSGGWWKTGDVVSNDNGKLVLRNRIQEKIIKNGYNISPRDVEWAIQKHDKINEIFVLGLHEGDELNDLLVYFVVGNISKEELTIYCKNNLPAHWRPDIVSIISEIPKTSTGKPVLFKLKEMATRQFN